MSDPEAVDAGMDAIVRGAVMDLVAYAVGGRTTQITVSDAVERIMRAAQAEVERLQALLAQAREALEFYADAENWHARVIATAPQDGPNAGAQLMEPGPANDGGDRARSVLASLTGDPE